ncbi:class I SAM-dependent methyltransferase [Keratinibaculum paraultunense]|nr:class I SAM-dependent methyltransferase [Keratinibaculum paraultunense]QQY80644.1 class I SAM-dependent methyltransferase [Keratinibaculum paraultunense]
MKFKHFINPVETVKKIMYYYVKEGYIALDCTVGNGKDTLRLAKLVGKNGKVYGFDIQGEAINNTKNKLKELGLEQNVILINDGHENINKYIHENLDFIVYNLGYLPGGDKNIKTQPTTTIKSLKKALPLLNNNGLLLITCYVGHDGGKEEQEIVEIFLKSLDQKMYNVLQFKFINQRNNPPILYGVEKTY